jgi:hypothetical protein
VTRGCTTWLCRVLQGDAQACNRYARRLYPSPTPRGVFRPGPKPARRAQSAQAMTARATRISGSPELFSRRLRQTGKRARGARHDGAASSGHSTHLTFALVLGRTARDSDLAGRPGYWQGEVLGGPGATRTPTPWSQRRRPWGFKSGGAIQPGRTCHPRWWDSPKVCFVILGTHSITDPEAADLVANGEDLGFPGWSTVN